jgi:hypothetical protein
MKNRKLMYLFMWLGILCLAAGIVFVCYFQKPLMLALAGVSFFAFTVMAALFVNFAIRYSQSVNPPEMGPGPKAH